MPRFFVALVVLMSSWLAGGCLRPPPPVARAVVVDEPEPEDPVDLEGGAVHLRLKTSRGLVRVYRPGGYDPTTAGTVLYVHGYYTDLDQAYRLHSLAGQFHESGLNALFVSPEAPTGAGDQVSWPTLRELLETLEVSGVHVPHGRMVAVAHSGGFRTVARWLSEGSLDSVVLLDALYGNEADFGAWLKASRNGHRLVLVGYDTAPRVERFLSEIDEAVERDSIPFGVPEQSLQGARVVYLHSQIGHMELVTEGRALPAVLRLTRVPLVAQQ